MPVLNTLEQYKGTFGVEFQINSWRDKYFESKLQIRIVGNIFESLATDSDPVNRVLLVQCRQIFYNAGPTLPQHCFCCILSGRTPANTCHLPNTVSMLAQRLRHWPAIGTALGDCPVFAWTDIRVTLCFSNRQKSHYPDKTIHWPNADAMLGHRLWCWANITSTFKA